jgi:serine/threonine protein kinase
MYQHVSTTPPGLCQKVSSISPAVEQVVFKALAKDPQQRFTSVTDFTKALSQSI